MRFFGLKIAAFGAWKNPLSIWNVGSFYRKSEIGGLIFSTRNPLFAPLGPGKTAFYLGIRIFIFFSYSPAFFTTFCGGKFDSIVLNHIFQ